LNEIVFRREYMPAMVVIAIVSCCPVPWSCA
ncbi:MAG: hypothetical protein ACI9FN_003764, partial [Saprospiraceae bacterium]